MTPDAKADKNGWRSDMENAPRDGTQFVLCRKASWGVEICMRRVRWVQNGDNGVRMEDMGAWLFVDGIDDDFNEVRPTSGNPSWSIAADKYNSVTGWRWQPLPSPPVEGG